MTLIHRRADFRADPILVEEARRRANLTLLPSTVVEGAGGDGPPHRADAAEHRDRRLSHLPAAALFEAVGHLPEGRPGPGPWGSPRTARASIAAGEDCATPAPGVFAAGDVRAKAVRQLTHRLRRRRRGGAAACSFNRSSD